MSATSEEAVDQIFTLLKEGWEGAGSLTAGVTIKYPGEADPEPGMDSDGNPQTWVRARIRHSKSETHGMRGSNQGAHVRKYGTIQIRIYEGAQLGGLLSNRLGSLVEQIYIGKTTSGGIWFRPSTTNEAGTDGIWERTDVLVSFEYDCIIN